VVITVTETILVPTDGSVPATTATHHARLVAAATGADVEVLSVVPPGGLLDSASDPRTVAEAAAEDAARVLGGGDASDHQSVRDRVAAENEDVETDSAEPDPPEPDGFTVTTAVREGDPAETILAYARTVSADLIVMGTHGRTGVNRVVSGSVTERVTRVSDVPVFTVRADGATPTPDTYDTVLLPTDGSDCAEAAVDHAVALAEAFDAEIDVVSVVDVNTVAAQSELTNARLVLDELEGQAENAIERVVDRVSEAGIAGETAVIQGAPASGVMDYAEEAGVDLIVMGTHGRSGIDRFLLGSTTERLIRHASVPVVSVRGDGVVGGDGDETTTECRPNRAE
jgi:nucleotide-binding universal stress UspA family protein